MDEKDREKIYHFRERLEKVLAQLGNSEAKSENNALIIQFAHYLLARGLSPSNVMKYVRQIKRLGELLQKPFRNVTKDDIVSLVGKIETMNYTKHTRRTFKTNLKIFYRWLRGSEEYPDEVRWIKPGKANNSIKPGDLLTKEEVERMIDATTNPRDKALIAVMYESACRPQEILPLRIKQVTFDVHGALISVDGKIGVQRTVRLLASAPLLATWLNNYPKRSDPEAPLFPTFSLRKYFAFLDYAAFRSIIKKAARKAGIAKRIYPYLFRHSRLTELTRSGFTGYMFNVFAGWALDSGQPKTYIHLVSKDIDDAILRLNGILPDNKPKDEFLYTVCSRCKQKNSPGTKLCYSCGLPLDWKYATEIDQKKRELKEKLDRVLTELAKSPEILDILLNAISMLKSENQNKEDGN